MSAKHKRVIGTTDAAIEAAEAQLGLRLPPSFRAWLLRNNGLGVEDVFIFPVYDERDPRKTWDSIVRQYEGGRWVHEGLAEINFQHLLPFASCGSGDYCCFDLSRRQETGEAPVVLWSHETGETADRGRTFADFVARLERGDFHD